MTSAQKMGWTGGLAAAAAGSAAFCATLLALRGTRSGAAELNYVLLWLVAGLAAGLLVLHWRSTRRTVNALSAQLDRMAAQRELGLVMVDGGDELAGVAGPLNHLLTGIKDELNAVRAANRELQIQSHIAEAEKKHTEAIVYSISDAVVVTNRFDELILANPAAEKLLGFDLEHSLRKNIDHILHDGTLVRLVRETRSGGLSARRKVVEHAIDQKGQPRTFSVTLSCVLTGTGDVSGAVAVLHDVTREKEIAQLKTDFVSSVSHELRTPLASIKAYVEMLEDGEAADAQTRGEFYGIIAGEADRLSRLIDNILNISRIESGVVRVVREPVSLPEVCQQALDVLAPQAKAKRIRLEARLDPAGRAVEADRDMLCQAVLNLVGNALKYTPEGGAVTVTADVDERRGVALCEVRDTGVGIGPDDLPHIFDKFYRVQSHVKMAKGTGLGLTLVKHIIETVHEGKLSVTSETGKGSTFSFELPLVR